jgi:hypothetical protein
MKRKSDSLHLEIQTHQKNPYGLLRNSYWEEGKVRHEVSYLHLHARLLCHVTHEATTAAAV